MLVSFKSNEFKKKLSDFKDPSQPPTLDHMIEIYASCQRCPFKISEAKYGIKGLSITQRDPNLIAKFNPLILTTNSIGNPKLFIHPLVMTKVFTHDETKNLVHAHNILCTQYIDFQNKQQRQEFISVYSSLPSQQRSQELYHQSLESLQRFQDSLTRTAECLNTTNMRQEVQTLLNQKTCISRLPALSDDKQTLEAWRNAFTSIPPLLMKPYLMEYSVSLLQQLNNHILERPFFEGKENYISLLADNSRSQKACFGKRF